MNLINILQVVLVLSSSVSAAEPNWISLGDKMEKALGQEWTVYRDFNSFVATRKKVQFLNTVSSIDAILRTDPWDKALISDYMISVTIRPRISQKEYLDLLKLRDKWVDSRTRGLDSSTKEAYSTRKDALATIELPTYYFGSSSVFIDSSDEGFFKIRPESVLTDRDRILTILREECHPYQSKPEQGGADQPTTARESKSKGNDKPHPESKVRPQ